jgi:hypothetical protein
MRGRTSGTQAKRRPVPTVRAIEATLHKQKNPAFRDSKVAEPGHCANHGMGEPTIQGLPLTAAPNVSQ